MVANYVRENGSIVPASLIGTGNYMGRRWPAELSKRCRELRARKILKSPEERIKGMEIFFFHPYMRTLPSINLLHDYTEEAREWESRGEKTKEETQVEAKQIALRI